MDKALWQRIEPLLDRVLDLDTEQRKALIEKECVDDPELRQELERFLDDCLDADGFLDAETLSAAKHKALDQTFEESLVDRRFGAFKTTEILGRGGMGTVLLAERADGHFEKRVAIKVVSPKRLGEEGLERFRFERQILADLEHPNIASLLDGGVSNDGIPFLVMEHVDGLPLDRHAEQANLSIPDRIGLLIDICSAIDHAHRHRVVHLDLKPSNILVTADHRPLVLDFGIAQIMDRQSPGGSGTSGRLTPQYAAPEQLREQPVTNSCDVYSLGVLLFQMLTGRLPFTLEGQDLQAFIETVNHRPSPKPSSSATSEIAEDLDAVVAKALQKKPSDRYGSPMDLAEDLRRVLEKRPVEARPQTRRYLLSKHIQRNRWAWVGALLTLFAVSALTYGWWQDRRDAQQRLAVAQDFAREAEGIDSFLRYAYALPSHDVRREKSLTLERMARLEAQMNALGPVARGPGNLALGRALLSLRRPFEAKSYLEKAWQEGQQDSTVAFSLGKALVEIYNQQRIAAVAIRDPLLREIEIERLIQTYREPALQYLSQVDEVSEIASPAMVSAMNALLEERFDDALRLAEQAASEAPWLPDGKRLQGEAWGQIAQDHVAQSRWQEALDAADRAIKALRQAAELAPSDTLIADILCDTYVTRAVPGSLKRVSQDLSAAIDACGRASDLDPDLVHSRLQEARLELMAVQSPAATLDQRLARLEQALSLVETALTSAPGDPDGLTLFGSALLNRAVFLSRAQGLDPREDLEKAADSLRRAVAASPGQLVAHINLGTTNAILAEERLARGGDPEPAFDQAIASFQEALDRSPTHGPSLTNLGNLLFNRSIYQMHNGQDPSRTLERVIEICDQTLSLNPELLQPHNLKAATLEAMAGIALLQNRPSEDLIQQSQLALDRALEINPDYLHSWINQGSLRLTEAKAHVRKGADPHGAFEKAKNALDHGLGLTRTPHAEIAINRAEALLLQVRHALYQQEALEDDVQARLEETLTQGTTTFPRSHLIQLNRIRWQLIKARLAHSERGRRESLDRVGELIEELLALRPKMAEVRLRAVEAYLWREAFGLKPVDRAAALDHLDSLARNTLVFPETELLKKMVEGDFDIRTIEASEEVDPVRRSELVNLGRRLLGV